MGPRGGGGGIRVKRCELCVRPARIHCESDEASLCWECDAKVHGANFLVARHSRCLLCRSCQSPTPWRAEGARLRPTFSVCERCAAATSSSAEGSGGGEGCGAGDEEEGAGEGGRRDREEDEEEEEEEDEEGENQVVPWSLTPPPAASSSSSSEGEEEPGRMGNGGRFLKRMRENAHLSVSQDDLACSSSLPSYLASSPAASPAAAAKDETISYVSAFRSSKDRKRPALRRPTPPAPCSMSASTATSIT
ncbi:BBOX [Musa troglodytarum]|uniref:BBOX n=1 Tax=Musa troglodytarum TaxID=320322 RepID=A0A9E7EU56_9LILI|nr:BBOX [Musa troglodytarum]